MWVSYVNGTPKMSQIGPRIYGMTHLQPNKTQERPLFIIGAILQHSQNETESGLKKT